MADEVLGLGRKLGKTLLLSLRNEKRIVAKPSISALREQDRSFHRTGAGVENLPLMGQGEHTAEPGLPVLTSGQLPKQLGPICFVGGSRSGIPGRVDARRAAKGIDLEAGIVRQHDDVREKPGSMKRLDLGVRLEAVAILHRS